MPNRPPNLGTGSLNLAQLHQSMAQNIAQQTNNVDWLAAHPSVPFGKPFNRGILKGDGSDINLEHQTTSLTPSGNTRSYTILWDDINGSIAGLGSPGDGKITQAKKYTWKFHVRAPVNFTIVPFVWVTPAAGNDPGVSQGNTTTWDLKDIINTFIGAVDRSIEIYQLVDPHMVVVPSMDSGDERVDIAEWMVSFEIDLTKFANLVAKLIESPWTDERPEGRFGLCFMGNFSATTSLEVSSRRSCEWVINNRPLLT